MADQFNENAKDIIVRYVDAVGYLDGLIGEIAAALRAERERGIGSFQDQIRERLIRDYKLPDASIDGGGSDSDHIDFTMAEIAQAVQQIEERAESRGFARGVRAAASLCVYRHRDGSVCLDRDHCTVDVIHQYYEPKALERLIRALIPKEPLTVSAAGQRAIAWFYSDASKPFNIMQARAYIRENFGLEGEADLQRLYLKLLGEDPNES